MSWDVLFYDEATHTAYRVQAKRMTVGDGIAADTLQDEIARRDDLQGRALLTLTGSYPLLRHGSAAAEIAACSEPPAVGENGLPVLPDDLPWYALDLTEAAFWALDEYLLLAWLDAVLVKNPHRDQRYERLKKSMMQVLSTTPTPAATPVSVTSASGPGKT